MSFKFFGQHVAVCGKKVVINVRAHDQNADRIRAIRIDPVGGGHVCIHLVQTREICVQWLGMFVVLIFLILCNLDVDAFICFELREIEALAVAFKEFGIASCMPYR